MATRFEGFIQEGGFELMAWMDFLGSFSALNLGAIVCRYVFVSMEWSQLMGMDEELVSQ